MPDLSFVIDPEPLPILVQLQCNALRTCVCTPFPPVVILIPPAIPPSYVLFLSSKCIDSVLYSAYVIPRDKLCAAKIISLSATAHANLPNLQKVPGNKSRNRSHGIGLKERLSQLSGCLRSAVLMNGFWARNSMEMASK